MTNDLHGFVAFLRDSKLNCVSGSHNYPAHVDNEYIVCAPVPRADLEAVDTPAYEGNDSSRHVHHCHVKFGDTILRLDNDADYYFAFYDRNRNCANANGTNYECVTCTWTAGHAVRHLRRCGTGNECTGPVEWYDERDAVSFSPLHTYRDDDSEGNVNDGHKADEPQYESTDAVAATGETTTTVLTPAAAETKGAAAAAAAAAAAKGAATSKPVQIECPDARIRMVDPLSASWAGGSIVRITVTGHRILADNRTVTVRLAGRYCAYPQATDDTIACTVSPSARADEPAEGPVVVEYGGGPRRRSFAVRSAHLFQFVMPVVSGVSPSCGPLKGGTVVTVRGQHLNTGTVVDVSLGDNRTCTTIERLDTRIQCLTGAVTAPVEGPVTVVFDKTLSRPAADGRPFAYTSEPALAPGQRAAGIASGGTAVPVRGAGFSCVGNASLFVEHTDGKRRYSTCHVQTDSFVSCRAPELTGVQQSAAADSPTSLNYGVRVIAADGGVRDLYPRPGDAGFDLYSDPVFSGFEIIDGAVVIAGAVDDQPDRGYRKEDVAVRFPANSDAACVITSMAHNRIVCVSTKPNIVHGLRDIIVAVGEKFVAIVSRKTGTYDGYKLFSAFSGAVLFAGIVLLCLRTLRQANLGGGGGRSSGGRTFELKIPADR